MLYEELTKFINENITGEEIEEVMENMYIYQNANLKQKLILEAAFAAGYYHAINKVEEIIKKAGD